MGDFFASVVIPYTIQVQKGKILKENLLHFSGKISKYVTLILCYCRTEYVVAYFFKWLVVT